MLLERWRAILYTQKNFLSYLRKHSKIKKKLIMNLTIKPKIIKFSKESIRENL